MDRCGVATLYGVPARDDPVPARGGEDRSQLRGEAPVERRDEGAGIDVDYVGGELLAHVDVQYPGQRLADEPLDGRCAVGAGTSTSCKGRNCFRKQKFPGRARSTHDEEKSVQRRGERDQIEKGNEDREGVPMLTGNRRKFLPARDPAKSTLVQSGST